MTTESDFTRSAINSRLRQVHKVTSYTRTEEDYGVTHISFRIGISNGFHVFCALTTIGLANMACAVRDSFLDTNHVYFDTDTGEYLGTSRNEAADQLQKLANEHKTRNQFLQMKKCFTKAHQLCTDDHVRKTHFLNEIDHAQRLLHEEALREVEARIQNCRADRLNEQGLVCLNQQNFEGTRHLFRQARQTCTSDYRNRDQFGVNETNAQRKIDQIRRDREEAERIERAAAEAIQIWNIEAESLNDEGLRLLNQNLLQDAQNFFEQSFNKCSPDYRNRNSFKSNHRLATSMIEQEVVERLERENTRQEEAAAQMAAEKHQRKVCEVADAKRKAAITRRKAEEAAAKKKAEDESAKNAAILNNGKELWAEAWRAEENGDVQKAENLFRDAQAAFQKCLELVAEQYLELVNLKIEGNSAFNQGIRFHESGNDLCTQNELKGAMAKYQCAHERFTNAGVCFSQGLRLGEGRFAECKAIVDDLVTELGSVMDIIKIELVCVDMEKVSLRPIPTNKIGEEFSFQWNQQNEEDYALRPHRLIDD